MMFLQFSLCHSPSWHLLVDNQQPKHKNNVYNLFKVNNKDVNDIVLVFLLLILDRFNLLFWCFHCLP